MNPTQAPPDLILYHPRHQGSSGPPWTYYVVQPGRSRTSVGLTNAQDISFVVWRDWPGLRKYHWKTMSYARTRFGRQVEPRAYPEGTEQYTPTYLPEEGVILLHPDFMPKVSPLNAHAWRAQKAAERRARPRMVLWYVPERTPGCAVMPRPIHHVLRPDGTITGPLLALSEVRRALKQAWGALEPAPNQPLGYLRKHYGQEVQTVPPPPAPLRSGCYLPDLGVIVLAPEWSLLTPRPHHDPRKPPQGIRYVTAVPGPGAWRVDPRTGTLEPIPEIPPGVDRRRIRNLIAEPRPAHEPHDFADFGRGRIFFQKSAPGALHLPTETP